MVEGKKCEKCADFYYSSLLSVYFFAYISFANTGYTSEPLLRTYPLYIVENKVRALSRRCRDHRPRRCKHAPPFFRRSHE